MCGIAGFVDFAGADSDEIIAQMTKVLHHRGPDGQGEWVERSSFGSVGLGHTRLSVIDLSPCGTQPMHYDGLHLIFNGEIYNYVEIKEELQAKGHVFASASDTEVILHSWREWKQDAIAKWRGMFSIVLYDENCLKLFLIRDRAGVKPLFYYRNKKLLLFASELKALLAHPGFEAQIDVDAVANYLRFGCVSHPHCIYTNCYKVSPGTLVEVDLSNGKLTEKQYWNVFDLYNRPVLKINYADAVVETERVLTNSFNYRLIADVPVGIFLSGGYDSTCLTALLQRHTGAKIKTFTIGNDVQKYNEAHTARQVASLLGTDHCEYYCTEDDVVNIIPELSYYYDEPFADSSAIPTMIVSRLARKSVTVALSADGGDEIFAGYNRYVFVDRYYAVIAATPKPVRFMALGVMKSFSALQSLGLFNRDIIISRYEKIKNLLADPSPTTYLKNIAHVFSHSEIKNLMNVEVRELTTWHENNELINRYYNPMSHIMAVDYQTYLTDDILQKVDRATMSSSLEGREPFLDQNIIDWAAQLPSVYKYGRGEKKRILKDIVHQYIPRKILEGPKKGFSIPMDRYLSRQLKPLVEEYLSDEMLNMHMLFNSRDIRSLVRDFYRGKSELHTKVWYLLMFQMWYSRWLRKST